MKQNIITFHVPEEYEDMLTFLYIKRLNPTPSGKKVRASRSAIVCEAIKEKYDREIKEKLVHIEISDDEDFNQ